MAALISNPMDVISSVADLGKDIIDKIWPDPAQREAAKLELLKLQQSGELAEIAQRNGLLQGQIDVNKAEAANPSVFVAGWRPFIGWTCGAALACYFVPKFLVGTALWIYACWIAHGLVPSPDLGIAEVLELTASMLGIGTLRTLEKKWGVATAALALKGGK